MRPFLIYSHSITSFGKGIEILGPSFLVNGPDSDQFYQTSTAPTPFNHFAYEGALHSSLPHHNFVLVFPYIPLILEISPRGTFCIGFPPRCSLLPNLTLSSSSHVGLPALPFLSTAHFCISLVPNDHLPSFSVTKAPRYQG